MTLSVWLKHPGLSAGVEEMVVRLAGGSYRGGDGGGSMSVKGRDRRRLLPAPPNVRGTHRAQLNIRVVVSRRRFDAHCLCLLQFLLTLTEDDTGERGHNDNDRDGHHKDDAKHPVPPTRHSHRHKQLNTIQ